MNNSILAVIKSRFPGFVGRRYPMFEKFMIDYFSFLETDGEVINYINNFLDNTDSANEAALYWDKILADLGWTLDVDITIDKRVFVLLIRDYYASRGTLSSLKFLFKLIFGKRAYVSYPRDELFIVSKSNYFNQTIMYVNASSISNNILRKIQNSADVFGLYGEGVLSKSKMIIDNATMNLGYLKLSVSSSDVFIPGESIKISGEDFHVIAENIPVLDIVPVSSVKPCSIGDEVIIPDALYHGKVTVSKLGRGIVDSVIVKNGGTGYKDKETILSTESNGFYGKIVTKAGVVDSVSVMHHGYGMKQLPSIYALSDGVDAEFEAVSTTIGQPKGLTIYEPVLVSTSYNVGERDYGNIKCNVSLAAMFTTVSTWRNDNHILEQNCIIIDSYYYQQFSYKIESDVARPEYEHIVKGEVHPAGYVMFSKLKLNNHNTIKIKSSHKVTIK